MSIDHDPTRIEITTDPTKKRMIGVAYHGNTPFDVPYISEIAPNLWQGGCEDGLVLPENIDKVLSLYPWEKYTINRDNVERVEIRMYDSLDQSFKQVFELARMVNDWRADGHNVLVHCQAGLNRSSLVAAVALLESGEAKRGLDAIKMIREKRSPACLCNPAFEDYIISL